MRRLSRSYVRRRAPSPALVVALIALFVALGGTSYAAIHLPAHSVGTKQLKNHSVGSKQLKKNAVVTNAIKDGAVTAGKIDTSGLTVPNAAHATSADSATSATNATQLGGVAASGYTLSGCSAQRGAIKGWAAVTNASASFSSSYVNVPGYNCSGGAVQAKRLGVGLYEVKFVNSPVTVLVGTINGGSSPTGFVDSHENGPGDFTIGTRDTAGALADGHGFALITP